MPRLENWVVGLRVLCGAQLSLHTQSPNLSTTHKEYKLTKLVHRVNRRRVK